ncbi:MAG: tetratricopeptide repeat protein [Candidatus Omnitrophica bacterium]|nr:tetratricopeptide repeat protein [Candidatus Omnitrophota bacterium]
MVTLCLSIQAHAAGNDYEQLVQRNLELRQQLEALEQKYTQLENERNVLIVHIRNLQEEKEKLISSGAGTAAPAGRKEEGSTSGDELKAAFSEVSKELGLVAKERDRLKKEFARLKEDQSRSEAAVKAMEGEKASLNEQLDEIRSTFQANQAETTAAVGSLQTEKTSLAEQIGRLKETFEKEKEDLLARQARAVEEAGAEALAQSQRAARALEEERTRLYEDVTAREQSLEGETKNLRAQKEKAVEDAQKKNKETIKALEKEKTRLAGEMAVVKESLAKENADLTKRLATAGEGRKRLEEELAQRALEMDRLRKDLEEKIAANEKELAAQQAFCEMNEAKWKADLQEAKEQGESALDKAQADFKAKEDAFGEEKAEFEKNRLALDGQLKEAQAKMAAGEKQLAEERVSSQAQEAGLKAAAAKSAETRKQSAMELAIFQTREAELTAERRKILLDNDQLKARLEDEVKAGRSLEEEKKDVQDKWQQSLQKIDELQGELKRKQGVFSKEQKERGMRLSRLARSLTAAQDRVKKLEGLKEGLMKELKAGQLRQREQENFINKLLAEKSALEAKLAKGAATAERGTFSLFPKPKRKNVRAPVSSLDKQKLDMHFNLAVAYDKTGLYGAEEREYLECLKLDPDDANVHYNLGILYDDKLNDGVKALKHYRRYLELRPSGEDVEQVKEWILTAEQKQRLKTEIH